MIDLVIPSCFEKMSLGENAFGTKVSAPNIRNRLRDNKRTVSKVLESIIFRSLSPALAFAGFPTNLRLCFTLLFQSRGRSSLKVKFPSRALALRAEL